MCKITSGVVPWLLPCMYICTNHWLEIISQFKSWIYQSSVYWEAQISNSTSLWNWRKINPLAHDTLPHNHQAEKGHLFLHLELTVYLVPTQFIHWVIKIIFLAIYLNYIESLLVGTTHIHSCTESQELWWWWVGSEVLERMISTGDVFIWGENKEEFEIKNFAI